MLPHTEESAKKRGKRRTALRWSSGAKGASAAIGTTLLIRLSLPPFDFWPLALICWTPLLALVGRIPTLELIAWTLGSGVALNLLVHWWVVPSIIEVASAPPWAALGALVALSVVQGTRMPMIMLLIAWGSRWRWPIWLSFPLATVVMERVHPHLFPWTMALGVHSVPIWLQAAAFGGAYAVSGWLALVNGLLAAGWQGRASRPRLRRRCAAAGGVVLTASLFGDWALEAGLDHEREAAVAQVAFGHVATGGNPKTTDEVAALRNTTLELLQHAEVDVVVWPETTLQVPDLEKLPRLARDYLFRDRAQGTRGLRMEAPLIVGAVIGEGGERYNSAVLVHPPAGTLVGRYDKRALVPLGESSQLASWFPDLRDLVPAVTPFAQGVLRKPLTVGERNLALSICYEDILAEPFRESVLRSNPELLVNLTSDAWFAGTAAKDFHYALAKIRSVEHGKYLVRATRDGVSGVVDSVGRVRARVDEPTTRVRRVEARWLAGLTPYARYGDTWLWLLLTTAALAALVQARAGPNQISRRAPTRDSPKET